MAIDTDAAIWFFGTQDEVTSGTPATIANNAYGLSDQGTSVDWTNADDATHAGAVLKCQFDTTQPSAGNIFLIARLHNVQSTNDVNVPDANFEHTIVGQFPVDFGVSADTDFYTVIPDFEIPMIASAQRIDWWLKNNGTGQTLGVSWQLWITPKSVGPHG